MRITPYPPIFNSTPARIIEIGVGASTWASGSHVCNGTDGSLMINPTSSSRNAHHETDLPQNGLWNGSAGRGDSRAAIGRFPPGPAC